MHIRDATAADAAACAAIYAPYVTDTAISFEEVPPAGGVVGARRPTAAPPPGR
ncbi:GNAT family N-acetyltransferase, partial [Mycobacteroides abscessus subsp. abscessus]